jgi:hypothetical protein
MQKEANLQLSYSSIIFALGIVAWGVSKLLTIQSLVSYWIAGVLVFLATITCVVGLVHYWRYGMHR